MYCTSMTCCLATESAVQLISVMFTCKIENGLKILSHKKYFKRLSGIYFGILVLFDIRVRTSIRLNRIKKI